MEKLTCQFCGHAPNESKVLLHKEGLLKYPDFCNAVIGLPTNTFSFLARCNELVIGVTCSAAAENAVDDIWIRGDCLPCLGN